MIPSIQTTFQLAAAKLSAKVQDIFNYTTLIYGEAYGNVKAKKGNTIFHENTSWVTPDITLASTTIVEIDLPLNDDGLTVQQGGYEFIYSVELVDQLLYGTDYIGCTASASPITEVYLNAPDPNIAAAVTELLATLSNVRIVVYDSSNNELGEAFVIGATDEIIYCTEIDYTGTIGYFKILGTNIYSKTFAYDFSTDVPEAEICVEVDCYRAQLTAYDRTVYPSDLSGEATRVLKIQYPRLSTGSAVHAPATTSSSALTIGPNLYSGTFTTTVTTEIAWAYSDGLNVTATVIGYNEVNVQCDAGLCCAYSCIKNFFDRYKEAIRVGSRSIEALKEQNFMISKYVELYNIAVGCRNTTDATTIITELKAYMQAKSADCGQLSDCCGEQNEPTIIYPLFSAE